MFCCELFSITYSWRIYNMVIRDFRSSDKVLYLIVSKVNCWLRVMNDSSFDVIFLTDYEYANFFVLEQFLTTSGFQTGNSWYLLFRPIPPNETSTLDRKFNNESFGASLRFPHTSALSENRCFLFLGWKGMTLKIKILKFEISSKSYIDLSILFLETQTLIFLRLLCLVILSLPSGTNFIIKIFSP